MGLVQTALGAVLSPLLLARPVWAVKLTTGKWLSERDYKVDTQAGRKRPFDWTLDLIDTGDISKVKELWIIAPPGPGDILGVTRSLTITEPGIAFQFKVGNVDAWGGMERGMESQVIGKVTNKETGECECWIYDAQLKQMGSYYSSVYKFGSWREGIAPIGALSHDVMGLRLGINVSCF